MADTYRNQFLAQMRDGEAAFDAFAEQMAGDIERLLRENVSSTGALQAATGEIAQRRIGRLILEYFVALLGGNQFSPLSEDVYGNLTALSPFMRLLWGQIEAVTRIAVEQQAAILRRYLRTYPALAQQLGRSGDGYRGDASTPAQRRRVERYVPPQDRVWDDGRMLADRILTAATDARTRVLMLLRQGIAQQMPLDTWMRELRQLLAKGTPSGLYMARRLFRAEVMEQFHQASEASAALNPVVVGVDWMLSIHHPQDDVCDVYAANSPYDVDRVPARPHPGCLCYLRFRTRFSLAAVERAAASGTINPLTPTLAQILLRRLQSGVE